MLSGKEKRKASLGIYNTGIAWDDCLYSWQGDGEKIIQPRL